MGVVGTYWVSFTPAALTVSEIVGGSFSEAGSWFCHAWRSFDMSC